MFDLPPRDVVKIKHKNPGKTDRWTQTFHEILDSSDFFEKAANNPAVYKAPVLGDDFQLAFGGSGKVASYHEVRYEGEPDDLVLHVEGTNPDDFAWVFRKVYDHREEFEGKVQ